MRCISPSFSPFHFSFLHSSISGVLLIYLACLSACFALLPFALLCLPGCLRSRPMLNLCAPHHGRGERHLFSQYCFSLPITLTLIDRSSCFFRRVLRSDRLLVVHVSLGRTIWSCVPVLSLISSCLVCLIHDLWCTNASLTLISSMYPVPDFV